MLEWTSHSEGRQGGQGNLFRTLCPGFVRMRPRSWLTRNRSPVPVSSRTMNYPAASHGVSSYHDDCHTCARVSRKDVSAWIPAFAGMTKPQQAAANETHRDPIALTDPLCFLPPVSQAREENKTEIMRSNRMVAFTGSVW
jgi:hypothetical protein